LRQLVGMVVVSGYRCDQYDRLFAGWQRIDGRALADGAKARVESLWLSPNVRAPGLDFLQDHVA
jgi:DNA adenine methylase